ncbi:MAG: SurA N-terminal domain-containing protein [Caldilineaceae bacterium]
MLNKSLKIKSLVLLIITCGLIGGVLLNSAAIFSLTPFAATKPLINLGSKAVTIVATVNGEAITLGALETTRVVMQMNAANQSASKAKEYQEALDYQIRETLLRQEAKRRGITVDEAQVKTLQQQMKESIVKLPETQQFIDAQINTLGISREQYEQLALTTFREGLLGQQVLDMMKKEAPQPSDASIAEFLRKHLTHSLTLMTIRFTDGNDAKKLHQELITSPQASSSEQLENEFASYTEKLGEKRTDGSLHETFEFQTKNELPDYAQDALDKPEKSMNLYQRSDGIAILYFVLAADTNPIAFARIQEDLRQAFLEEKQDEYVEGYLQRIRNSADVHIFSENIPS